MPVDIDRKRDLALIRVDDPLDFKPLRLAVSAHIQPGMRVISLGFPALGADLDAALADNWVTVHSGKILQIFRDGAGLSDIAVDTNMWQGASGGPVLNSRGELVGVVQKGRLHSKLNLAITSNVVAKYLAQPKIAALVNAPRIRFTAPTQVEAANASDLQAFSGTVIPGLDPIDPSALTLELSASGGQSKRIHGIAGADGASIFHVPIFTNTGGPHTLQMHVFKAPGGAYDTVVSEDFPLQIGGRAIPMREVSRIESAAASSAVTLLNGEVLHLSAFRSTWPEGLPTHLYFPLGAV